MVRADRGLYAGDLPADPNHQAALLRWVKRYNDGELDLFELVDLADSYGVKLTVTDSRGGVLLAVVEDWTTYIDAAQS